MGNCNCIRDHLANGENETINGNIQSSQKRLSELKKFPREITKI